jgi:VWFA-related protein
MKKILFWALIIGIFVFIPVEKNLLPQSKDAKKENSLQHEVSVVLKLVQVYVTDKEGKPITDLEISDFVLYDNGKLKTITDLEKHFLERIPPSPEKKETLIETGPEEARKIPSRLNRKLFFFFDLSRQALYGYKPSKKAALHFLETKVKPTDEIGMIIFSEIGGMDVREYLTTDHEKIKKTIEGLDDIIGKPSTGGMSLEGERARAEASIPGEGESVKVSGTSAVSPVTSQSGGGIASRLARPVHPQSEAQLAREMSFLDIMKEMAKSLRYIPGNKNIVYFSNGFTQTLYLRDLIYQKKFDDMAREFAMASAPIHTVNTAGQREHFRPPEYRGDFTLKKLSDTSGGKYFEDVRYYESISEGIQNITSNYYVLGYKIDEKWDGKYHEIKVKVKREGCKIAAQGGYFNPKPYNELSDIEKQFYLIDLAVSGTPQFQDPGRFPIIGLPCSDQKNANFVLISEIPRDKIQEVIAEETELFTMIFDTNNSIIDSTRSKINFKTLPDRTLYHYQISSLKPGAYECRVVLRNMLTGKGAVGSTSVKILEPFDTGFKLYPPLLLFPGKDTFFLKASKIEGVTEASDIVSLNKIYPFISNEFTPLFSDLNIQTKKLLAVVRSTVRNINNPDIKLEINLIEKKTEKKTVLDFSILDSQNINESTDALLLELPLPEVKPGRYTVEILGEESNTGTKTKVSRVFEIR